MLGRGRPSRLGPRRAAAHQTGLPVPPGAASRGLAGRLGWRPGVPAGAGAWAGPRASTARAREGPAAPAYLDSFTRSPTVSFLRSRRQVGTRSVSHPGHGLAEWTVTGAAHRLPLSGVAAPHQGHVPVCPGWWPDSEQRHPSEGAGNRGSPGRALTGSCAPGADGHGTWDPGSACVVALGTGSTPTRCSGGSRLAGPGHWGVFVGPDRAPVPSPASGPGRTAAAQSQGGWRPGPGLCHR